MTVLELIEKLKKLPPDVQVYRTDGEYLGSCSPISKVVYQQRNTWSENPNSVLIT